MGLKTLDGVELKPVRSDAAHKQLCDVENCVAGFTLLTTLASVPGCASAEGVRVAVCRNKQRSRSTAGIHGKDGVFSLRRVVQKNPTMVA
jgi:hypothetical protein